MGFGERVRCLREERGWSLDVLAERVAMDRTKIHRIETGKQEPRMSELRAFARVFNLSAGDLLGDATVAA